MNRRNFIEKTSIIGAMMPLSDFFASNNKKLPSDFKLTILATNWGFAGSIDEFAKRAKDEGYDGVELWLPSQAKDQDTMMNALSKNNLKYGFLCGSGDSDFNKNLENFEQILDNALSLKPLFFNSHSGKDYFSSDQANKFFDLTDRKSKDSKTPIYHETHRGRLCFAAHITYDFLKINPNLRLTADFSHWCNVAESLLEDQSEVMDLAIERADHIHARIGHAEGPQVNDPRAPEWRYALERHLTWWDNILARKANTSKELTILTEFGPIDYLPALPYTRQPVANQWEINVFMKNLLRERYS
jgi:sugar phosphate isomerase/epimerase